MKSEKIILGIDPGTNLLGYGLLSVKNKQMQVIASGIVEMSKLGDHYLKLQRIFSRVLQLITEYLPDEMAIEAPFYGKNVQSMLKLGRAQGVAMAAALYRSVPITEYSPRRIKQAITGNGNASKQQVAGMLQSILNIKELPPHFDTTDALATAVCHQFQSENVVQTKAYKNWGDFIKQNPDRIK